MAWDIDSRMRLTRDDNAYQKPEELGHLLCQALQDNPDLNVYILNWDWAMLYTFEREWLPTYRPLWKHQERLHFALDGECPTTASHHQKIVVIDDKLAFCGGFDLGKHRWDSREHLPDDSRRIDPDKEFYPPFHDVQWMVDGEIAKGLGELVRKRWQCATGQDLPIPNVDSECWPEYICADFTDVDMAISRTQPEYNDQPAIKEIEQLYIDAINAAETLIYIENQYFTSHVITEVLSQRLAAETGPEVVIVLPKMTGGWLEQQTMDVLRARLMRKLRDADKHDRLRVCFPHRDALGASHISVHSKTLIIDDKLIRVGSSNTSNRSMGLDTECDLTFESTSPQEQNKVTAFRHDLLAEHFGMEEKQFNTELLSAGSLKNLIDKRCDHAHTLRPLDCQVDELSDQILPDSSLIDPEKPLQAEDMARYLVPIKQQSAFRKQLHAGVGVMMFVILLTVIWQFTPLGDWLTEENLALAANQIKQLPLSPVIVLTVFAICSLFAVPVSLLIIATVVTFGPWLGGTYALVGSLLGGLLGFTVGHLLGRGGVSRLSGQRINQLSRRLGKQGLWAVMTVRIIPVAPFTVINLVAGASHIKLRDFFWGSVLGLLPGVIAFSAFADSLLATIRQPDPQQMAILGGVVVVVIAMTVGLKKLFSAKSNTAKTS
ncbi:VTT domain-containing protein [Methylophaga sp. OBS3]|uniref:VTT domain-containing protein n=1 Tax=Methylophaga sp. OBS3 TaxID=2991934 RepID=UPI002251A36F|nr:VTT domain-containing protein [Methylophaga sp. OBS3]MCX4189656.1 VTT domain-containing protein [Methylophaga sp. OBS3]